MSGDDDSAAPYYVDVHCHLATDAFDDDLPEVIARAKEANVRAALVVAEDLSEFQKVLDLQEKYPDFVMPCLGIHPVQGDPFVGTQRSVNEDDLTGVCEFIEAHSDRIYAIGEVGLDFTPRFVPTSDDKDTQKEVLRKQIELAKKLDLPLNVHSRSAGHHAIETLRAHNAEKVVLHAFDGKPSYALQGVKHGYYFSIPPSIARSAQKQKLVKQLPLESLLLETDSPVLAAEEHARNEPMNITIACQHIADIKQIPRETVMKVILENTFKLFPKLRNILLKV